MKLSIITPVYNQEQLVIKELDHIPRRDDIEVIVCDDGSTDKTYENLQKYKQDHPELNLIVLTNGTNRGVAYTKNRMLDMINGEYFHIHDSDDYVDTKTYSSLIDCLGREREDIFCFDLIINNGTILRLTDVTKGLYCAQIARFICTDFAKDVRFPEEVRAGDDWFFAEELLKKNPKTVFSHTAAYFYNFPREGSLCDLRQKGVLP